MPSKTDPTVVMVGVRNILSSNRDQNNRYEEDSETVVNA